MTTEAATSAVPIGRADGNSSSAARIFLPWLACVALLAVTGLYINLVGAGLENDPRKDMFGLAGITIVGLLGGLGVYLASRTGFPAAWDARISNRVRFVYPLASVRGLGLVSIVLELLTGGIAFVLEDLGRDVFNAPLPGSILLYSAGAIVLEVVYRLLPIPVVMWVAQRFGFPERHRLKLFWVLAVLTSLLEPSGQTAIAVDAGRYDLAISQFALGFGYNLVQAYWFLRAGFLASLSVRWGHYAIWHVIYGGLICAC